MKGSIKLFTIFGISVSIHITFLLILAVFLPAGPRTLVLMLAIFCLVTLHELCHSLMAKRFGIAVREITLLPIGGVASMSGMPEKPAHEFLISIAGPAFNLAVIALFYLPVKNLLGPQVLFSPLSTVTWPRTLAYIYWINLLLAVFNLIPAFPMDGGRILRALLAQRLGYARATRIAVNFGHAFALFFAYLGIVRFNIMLVAIAIFIYVAASNEEMQVDIKETLKKFRVRDILSHDFFTLRGDTPLAKVLELIFRSRQEDFPVVDSGSLKGFATRQDIISGIHRMGMDIPVSDIMRKDFPVVQESDPLVKAQGAMQENGLTALPVMRGGDVIGVITLEDIGRIYAMASRGA